MSLDRLPPQSLEAEQSVLGALLIDRDAIIEVADVIRPGDFYRQANGKIYGVMVDLWERREPIDIVTVAEALERVGELEAIGGRGYLSSLAEQTPTAVFASQYARIVERKAVLRNLIAAAGRIAGIGYEDSPEVQEAIDRAEAQLYAVSERRLAAGFIPLKQLLHEAFDRLDDLHTHRGEISGVRTGFPDLDALTTGLQPSDLIILAARPSVGKTSLALNIAEHAAIGHAPARSVGIFSLEMSKEQLVLRLLSSVGGIDSQRLRTGFLDEMDFVGVSKAMTALSEAPIYIDDTPNISTMELRTKARRLQAEVGLDLVIVDYLQLMQSSTTTKDANRVQEVSEISRGLKALARELKVPVMALSQLSRQPEARTTPEPRLSDLRECVTGDTLVILADGRRVPIRDLVGTTPDVLAWHEDGRIAPAPADLVWSVGQKQVFTVRLASGRTVRATAKHRLLTGFGWRRVAEMEVGERLALARPLPEPAVGSAHTAFHPSRAVAASYATLLDDPELERMVAQPLFWDRVVAIEPAGVEEVFDLTVPGPSSWLADGLVSHNSGALEQDSDLVIFLWREKERSSEEHDADGEVVKLRLAKHRNGPTGEIDLWFKKSQTRFVNYAGDRYGGAAP